MTLIVLSVPSFLAAEETTYLASGAQHLGSEWSLVYDRPSLDGWNKISFEISYGAADWYPRVLVGLSLDHGYTAGGLAGVELPLFETELENTNGRAFGLVLRATGGLDLKFHPVAALSLGASICWAGFSGPGISVAYTTDRALLFGLTINGAVGLR